jgi:hypothetical protein
MEELQSSITVYSMLWRMMLMWSLLQELYQLLIPLVLLLSPENDTSLRFRQEMQLASLLIPTRF